MPLPDPLVSLAEQVSVVIPAFNEQDGIADVVSGVRSQARWCEVLVVDDGSSDATAARAEAAGARVLRHPYNKGNGAAVKTGIRTAAGEIVLLMDADGQHDPEEIATVLAPMGTHDMVIGARSRRDQDWLRAFGNALFQRFASWLTGRPIPDLTSGFRSARRARLLDIIHLLPNGFSYPTTSCLAFLKAGHSVTFVPVKARRRIGKSKIRVLRDGVRFLLLIVKVVTLYSPLKVFFPASALALLLGVAYGVWNVVVHQKIPMGAALLVQLSVIVFFFGLLSEQIASQQERK
jgi:glycosyltransferase involved in cell wall biosynthesis